MTVYIVDIEAVDTRYTKQWKEHLPQQIKSAGLDTVVISGSDISQTTTPGAFLNFAGTNTYKSQQLIQIANLFSTGAVKAGDYFLYTDAWNPTVIQLKYMSELLKIPVKIGGMWHAGSYDPQDFLGRLIGDVPWVRNAETSMFYCYNDNFFATRFHANMFLKNLLGVEVLFGSDELDEWNTAIYPNNPSIKIVGWPMEYLKDILAPYEHVSKKNKIIFPHRKAPEKQLEIFRDLAVAMPEYEWLVAMDHNLSKTQYHKHLAESKIVFSANLQETLGISVYEGAILGTFPLVPNRLSYNEMWDYWFRYPEEWTASWGQYQKHKPFLIERIKSIIDSNNADIPATVKVTTDLSTEKFFNGSLLYQHIKNSIG